MNLLDILKGKNILGHGLSIGSRGIKLASTALEGGKIYVRELKSIPLTSSEPIEIKKNLATLKITSNMHLAINVGDESLRIKKITLPIMPARDLPEAIRWQLMEDAENVQMEMEVRSTPLPSPISDKREYMVYGISRHVVEAARKKYHDLGLHVPVAEPVALSLAAWQDALSPNDFKSRGIFYLREGLGDFVGMKGPQVFYWKSFPLPIYVPSPSDLQSDTGFDERMNSELFIQFQQCLDDFLFHYQLSGIEEGVLAGDWDLEGQQQIEQSLGISCAMMGSGRNTPVVFIDDEQRRQAVSYAAELGLSVYPNREI